MKVTFTSGGATPIKVAELSLENVGVNRFRTSIPIQDGAGKVVSRTAEIEAASERTKAGTVRIMLKCTIPYFTQMLNEQGLPTVDSTKSPKPYTLHIVHTIPATMANEALNNVFARQAAQVACLASQIVQMGTLTCTSHSYDGDPGINNAPLQVGSSSVDGESSYPLTDAELVGTGYVKMVTNVASDALAGSFLGRALAGLMPIDINTDKTIRLAAAIDETFIGN